MRKLNVKMKGVTVNEKIAYIRVSTIDQNEERQIKAIEKIGIDRWYVEKISGKNTERKELQAMLDHIRKGDEIYILDFSRLARSAKDLLSLIELFEQKGVRLVSLKENLDTSTASGKLMLTLLAAINEFERTNLLERQAEGIAIAKAKGLYKGRKKIETNSEQFKQLYKQWKQREITKKKMAEILGIGRTTLYTRIKEFEQK